MSERVPEIVAAKEPAEILAAVARAVWATHHRGHECPDVLVPSPREFAQWLERCDPESLAAAVDRLKAISHGPPAAKPDSAGSRRSQSLCASGRPNDLPAGLGADAQESVTVGGDAPAGISLLDCAAVQRTWVMAVTAHMEATCPDAELPRHPLAPIVAAWQRRIRNVEPYRPKKRASLPRLHRVGEHDVDAAGLPSSLECAPRSAPPELPDLRFAGKKFSSWLLWLFDRAAVRAQGSGAPWAVRLFIGALLHLDMANRHGYWRTLRLPTNYVVSWLQPNGWANKRRDWQRFPTALTDLRDRLAAVPVPEIGLVTLMYPSVIPQRPSDPWVEFTIRVPLSAARGARIDWPLLCRYGQESAALYRTYLIVAHYLDRSAHRGHAITATIGAPRQLPTGMAPKRGKGASVVRNPDVRMPNPAARFVAALTDSEWTQMVGLDPKNRGDRFSARGDLARLHNDKVIDLQRDGRQFRIFGVGRN